MYTVRMCTVDGGRDTYLAELVNELFVVLVFRSFIGLWAMNLLWEGAYLTTLRRMQV
jgi:hypothetical protein